jgi:plastocyanin
VSACGDDKSDSADSGSSTTTAAAEPSTFAVTVAEEGKTTTITAPKTAEAGLAEITLTNEGKRPHTAQLIRVDDGHTSQEGLAAANAWGEGGKPLPDWVHLAGGLGAVEGGQTGTATIQLEPGAYAVADIQGNKPVTAEFDVTGEPSDTAAATADAKIEAQEYSFTAEGLTAGTNTIEFDNSGAEAHHAEAVAIADGATIDDVKQFFKTEKGKPPIDESKHFGTAVIDGGTSQTVELDLQAGRYAVLCFVPDREGGPPHAAKGMITEVEVE